MDNKHAVSEPMHSFMHAVNKSEVSHQAPWVNTCQTHTRANTHFEKDGGGGEHDMERFVAKRFSKWGNTVVVAAATGD